MSIDELLTAIRVRHGRTPPAEQFIESAARVSQSCHRVQRHEIQRLTSLVLRLRRLRRIVFLVESMPRDDDVNKQRCLV
jgi:hypothetical protein